MKARILTFTFSLIATFVANARPAAAQTPPPPPPPGWTGSVGAGLALTQGNSDTSTINAAYELKRDDGGDFVLKSTGLLVWGKSEGTLTSDHLALEARAERKLNERTAVFGQTQYLRDSFKSIDYLISPTVGLSRLLVKDDRTELGVDVAVGLVWEQNPDAGLLTNGAITAGQQFSRTLTATTELKQKLTALWTVDDFRDALYTLGVGLAAKVTEAIQLKVELLDSYKTQPPADDVRKNDVAVLVSFLYKFD